MLTNKYRTTFYIGVTADLVKRLYEHYYEIASVFTKKYNVKDLIYFEEFTDINQTIAREKQLKKSKSYIKNIRLLNQDENLKQVQVDEK